MSSSNTQQRRTETFISFLCATLLTWAIISGPVWLSGTSQFISFVFLCLGVVGAVIALIGADKFIQGIKTGREPKKVSIFMVTLRIVVQAVCITMLILNGHLVIGYLWLALAITGSIVGLWVLLLSGNWRLTL